MFSDWMERSVAVLVRDVLGHGTQKKAKIA